ncbi:MAG: MarR family transcriptional regulator [Luteolibacter sp.]
MKAPIDSIPLESPENEPAAKSLSQLGAHRPAAYGAVLRATMVLSTLRSRRISLSTLQAVLSLYLTRGEDLSLKDLAARLGITTAAVTNVADSIELLGFARRSAYPGDRRHTAIKITPSGVTFAESLCAMLAGTENQSS